ncbi:MAG: hypothetical protein F6K19_02340 [Cyanothece sp. SIO1E1]|nr:hypothetical protein [Cyanothece sp. SIO1E1]
MRRRLQLAFGVNLLLGVILPSELALCLPPPEDVPEEILRTEIIVEARSSIDGRPLTAAEYAELRAQLEAGPDTPPEISPDIRRLIFLLRVRKLIRGIFPFLLK